MSMHELFKKHKFCQVEHANKDNMSNQQAEKMAKRDLFKKTDLKVISQHLCRKPVLYTCRLNYHIKGRN